MQNQAILHPSCYTISRHLPGVPSLFQNSQKLSRLITVIWSEVKYVPSQIITATLCIALLSPAGFWEREVVKEDVIAAQSGGIRRATPWSPWARQRVWAGAPTPPPALTSHSAMSGAFHTPELQKVSYSYWTLGTCSSYCYPYLLPFQTDFTASCHECAIITNEVQMKILLSSIFVCMCKALTELQFHPEHICKRLAVCLIRPSPYHPPPYTPPSPIKIFLQSPHCSSPQKKLTGNKRKDKVSPREEGNQKRNAPRTRLPWWLKW